MNLIQQIAYYQLLGKPIIVYTGILTFLSLFATASAGFIIFKKIWRLPFKLHIFLAVTTLILAVIHALMGISLYF